MITCTWNFRRHAGRALVAATLVAGTLGLVSPGASADKLSDLKAQAQSLSDRIQNLGRQEDALAQQFDQAQLALQDANAGVAQATQQVDAANASTDRAREALRREAVDAYVHRGAATSSASSSALNNANDSLLRAEYADTLATNRSDAMDQYHQASLQAQTAHTNLAAQQAVAKKTADRLASNRQAVSAAQQQLQATQSQVQGAIGTEVARIQAAEAQAAAIAAQAAAIQRQQQQQQQAAAQAAAQAQAAQAAQARATASAAVQPTRSASPSGGGGGGGAALVSNSPAPPPPGHGASGAVAAALSRIGDPYVWGASGPSTFDCSGLVMWSYAQVGISLPHFSGGQYSSTTHISMSQLQPGDLVFPSNPGEHVAMYIGNGQIVEAPYTGATVHVVPLGNWFVSATRVA